MKPCSKEAIPDALANGKIMVYALGFRFDLISFLLVKSHSFWFHDFMFLKLILLFTDL